MTTIWLTEQDLLAKGNDRMVYCYPGHDDKLIKIVIPGIPKYKSKVREMYREIKECVPKNQEDKKYIQTIYGLVNTNLGIGEVTAKEQDRSAALAKTLYCLVKQGELSRDKLVCLNELIAWFMNTEVLINSLHCRNIVYAWDGERYRFKIIDGFGDKTFIQLSKFSSYTLARSKVKCLKRMYSELKELTKQYDSGLATITTQVLL